MKEYVASVRISAAPERVWAVLVDGEAYRQWNPEIVALAGHLDLGASIAAQVRLGDGAIRTVAMRVVEFEPPRRMTWVGGLPLGLFVGRRTFTVKPAIDGAEFQMHLQMTGPLSPLILRSVGDRQPEIDRFAAALKKRAEGPDH